MKTRTSKIRSLDAVNAWTLTEIGKGRERKIDKKIIKRKRRTIEKQQARWEVGDSY